MGRPVPPLGMAGVEAIVILLGNYLNDTVERCERLLDVAVSDTFT
jgi:hypothetical protein